MSEKYALVPVEPTPQMLEAFQNYGGAYAEDAYKAMLAAAPAPAVEPDTLGAICDLFMIGKKARTHAAIMANVENTKKFADMLNAVEGEFLMVPGDIDPDYPDDQPYDCLVNHWGSSVDQYVEQFREALKKIAEPVQQAEQKPVATIVAPDPEADISDEGPYMGREDWLRLQALPPGTSLYTTPQPAPRPSWLDGGAEAVAMLREDQASAEPAEVKP